jgi:hypothetical protein
LTRAQALATAAGIIAHSVPDLAGLVDLLEIAGVRRLATTLRNSAVSRPAEVGGSPRPNPETWRRGRVG